MIGETLRNFIESGSYFDLLLILFFYSIGWMVYIYFGTSFKTTVIPFKIYIGLGMAMGAICLLTKGYLPPLIFQCVILLDFTIIFLMARLKLWKAFAWALFLDLLILGSDYIIIEPIVRSKKGANFICNTSLGISVGTILETVVPGLYLIARRGVKTWIRKKKIS